MMKKKGLTEKSSLLSTSKQSGALKAVNQAIVNEQMNTYNRTQTYNSLNNVVNTTPDMLATAA